MKILQEFREFAIKGNVLDMAVGVIIGAEFGKIVNSLVNDIIMPPIGVLLGRTNFTELGFKIQEKSILADGTTLPEVVIKYGSFVQTSINFVIIAFSVFLVVKAANSLRKINIVPEKK